MRFVLLIFLAPLILIFRADAEVLATNNPAPGITVYSKAWANPPTRLFVAQVDLKNPELRLRVVRGGADPDGDGKWETTLLQPTKIARRENFAFVINGDFFSARNVKDGEGVNAGYRAGQWALVSGPAVTDGKIWSAGSGARPCVVVHKNHSVTIESLAQPAPDDWEVVSGNTFLVKNGVIVPHQSAERNPRTAVGLDATGSKLTILVVDGRKRGVAVGMTYNELAAEMLRLGCRQAINLDGGGSSIMAVREGNAGLKILNVPTDGHERAVADVLGISVVKS